MTERKIVGVDFSGAGKDDEVGNTWITTGRFDGNNLLVDDCQPISRNGLRELLMGLSGSAVAAMDFPFGVPEAFAKHEFGYKGSLMREMWEVVSNKIDNEPNYIANIRPRLGSKEVQPNSLRDLRKFNKLLRQWDIEHFPNTAFSPLNRASPEMFPMTFHGMRMLHILWAKTKCIVPPLDCTGRTGPVFLETMPGAALEAASLPSTNYKNNKGRNALCNLENRKEIIDGIQHRFGIVLPNFPDYHHLCFFNDDALDSIVAAIVAALWARAPALFHRPEDYKGGRLLNAARLEGCIYTPKPIQS